MRQLIKRFGIKSSQTGRVVHTGRVAGPSSKRLARAERTLRPRRKPRSMR